MSAVLFYCYGIYAAIAFLRQPQPSNPEFHPPVTILKPLCGLDSDAEDNLVSFCQQDYLNFQIIFAVRDHQDPIIKVVEKIIQKFPDIDITLVVSDRILGANLKVSNLANALTQAKHEILVIADSDIRVKSDYLQTVIQPLQAENVGVVTCLYRSLIKGWVTTLEAIWTATDFHPGVLVSNQIEGIKFAFGSTIVIRKSVLEKIGGFEAIADYLADDFQLGNLPAKAGYKVVLSNYVVEHVLGDSTIVNSLQRQIRWARGIRFSRPWGYLGLILTYGTVTSLLFLIVTKGSTIGWINLTIVWTIRLVMGWIVGAILLNDLVTKKYFWLIPLWDLLHFVIWCCGFVGGTIEWHGHQLRLTREGKLVTLEPDSLPVFLTTVEEIQN
ncbi:MULTISPECIES: bacteriohopanetetrol glucosamine biosynthesis glycosyltransferase HpnI [unclassified Nostoc]|uniref:bacteriohopanetetrol glucosamine biosynthesis glycosyltransferase HpnI n=1 Tax=unclassified Nostoc TaxID=2593658 RepID=UPI0028C408F4|nr:MULTISPECIES: bacteriohopanetetrol glucosamine biosynthesis glycosyltransferase HpnI [unclassified Nostoc]